MKIAGLEKQSLLDYPGEIVAVLFTQGCNLSCPFCHNGRLISSNQRGENYLEPGSLAQFLAERKGFLDGVVFSGGEPTLQPDLPQVIAAVKRQGYLIKLDTNGTNPTMLQYLLQEKLLDYVALDLKAPLDFKQYQAASGQRLTSRKFMNIRNSAQLLLTQREARVEFRTTVVPALHQASDVVAIARRIEGAQGYTLQQFIPENAYDPNFRQTGTYTKAELEKMGALCGQYVENVRILA